MKHAVKHIGHFVANRALPTKRPCPPERRA